jgi:hypothetical protein
MQGGLLSKGSKKKKQPYRPGRAPSARDIIREAYRKAGALDLLPKQRNTPSDLQRVLRAARITESLAVNLSEREQQELETDLSAIGIMAGRVSGTLPERLVAKWLLGRNVPYEGMGNQARLSRGFAFQVPLLGGRDSRGGTVADIVVSPDASKTQNGLIIYPEGLHFHNRADSIAKDEAKYQQLRALGYEVTVLWDYQAENPGELDRIMREAMRV